jgi:uncharacterized membrane protein
MEVNLCLPGIEDFNHMLKMCIGCFGVGVNVLVNVVIQMVQRVVVGYLEKKEKETFVNRICLCMCALYLGSN